MSQIKFVENYYFLENYVTSERAISHNVLYYQTLPIPIVSTAFNNNYSLLTFKSILTFRWKDTSTKHTGQSNSKVAHVDKLLNLTTTLSNDLPNLKRQLHVLKKKMFIAYNMGFYMAHKP